jgi:hypothetical protein
MTVISIMAMTDAAIQIIESFAKLYYYVPRTLAMKAHYKSLFTCFGFGSPP